MRARRVLLGDLGIAVVAAILILTLTPGLAVAAMIAISVLIACAISGTREARRQRAAHVARRSGSPWHEAMLASGRGAAPGGRRSDRARRR